jgi:hypothetical protein
VLNSPYKYTDPSGHWPTETFGGTADPVHDEAIAQTLGGWAGAAGVARMQHRQRIMDSPANQTSNRQYMHAMWDSRGGMSREEAIGSANAFVRRMLIAARAAGTGSDMKFDRLADGAHTLEDGTAPPHVGFQDWGSQQNWFAAGHGTGEAWYPGAGTPERRQLEGVTRWARDIASGRAAMPDRFFDPQTGAILLPLEYR